METSVFETLIEPIRKVLRDQGYVEPTPIQQKAIPPLLKGRDILGCAQTGTGKTAAFTLPLLQEMTVTAKTTCSGQPRALILTPTRELAAQIGESIRTYGRYLSVTHTVIYGGVGQNPQVQALQRAPDVVVATPGRLLDLMEQGFVQLDAIELFVLDEADRMLDMGFIPTVRRVVARLPRKRHSLFFSATMPPLVASLARELLQHPIEITIDPHQPTVDRIDQRMLFVDKADKVRLLADLIHAYNMDKVIVFTRTKHGADKVVKKLIKAGITACAIHGNKSQGARTTALAGFRKSAVRVMVATDIAARGLDVDGITHVVNFDLPAEPETYIHRIGRTARAGANGDAVSFCSARERDGLRAIETFLGRSIPVDQTHPYHSEVARMATGPDARPEPRVQQSRLNVPSQSKRVRTRSRRSSQS